MPNIKYSNDVMRKSYQEGWQQSTKNFDLYLKEQHGLGEKNNTKFSARRRIKQMVQQKAAI